MLALSPTNDVLAYNEPAGRIFFVHLNDTTDLNTHRLLFTDPYTRDIYADWKWEARLAVASLRFLSAASPGSAQIRNLVGELSVASREFSQLWAEHPVSRCTRGKKRLLVPEWGTIDLDYHVLHSPEGDGNRLLIHAAPAGTRAADLLELLGR